MTTKNLVIGIRVKLIKDLKSALVQLIDAFHKNRLKECAQFSRLANEIILGIKRTLYIELKKSELKADKKAIIKKLEFLDAINNLINNFDYEMIENIINNLEKNLL